MKTPVFSEDYTARLYGAYPSEIVDQVVCAPQLADLPDQPGEQIPYVRLNQGSGTPLFFVPGFGEGIINKASFAAELAARGLDVILPGQNRTSMLKDAVAGRQPTVAQARNYEAVLRAEGLADTTVDFASHSYGSLVLEALVKRMGAKQPDYFKDSQAILLAPAGMGGEKSLAGMARRWVAMLRSEWGPEGKDFPDPDGETGKASLKTLAANVPRTYGEIHDMLKHKVDFSELCAAVGHVTLLTYKEDKMFPQEQIMAGAAVAVEAGASWQMPISLEALPNGALRAGNGATHDDEQFNPSRVAGAVAQVVRSASH